MADPLREYPELRAFVLPNVRLTGSRIGAGAYGSVEEVEIPGAVCAAKKIHDIFQDRSEIPAEDLRTASAQFVKECQLMSTLRHPHIVQFLGVCFLPGSRLPALVMELLLTSLHDLLGNSEPPPDVPKPFFPLGLKQSILHDVALGLYYLHDRTPPIIHRDLSARNVLLNSAMVAKIADLGVARIVPRMRAAATMTKAPGAAIYMPPEALEAKSEDEEDSSKYDSSIDIFSFGVVAIFTLSQTFPCNLLAPTYKLNHRLVARNEIERRDQYMQKIYSQLRKNHPLIQVVEMCLHNFSEERPGIREVLRLLDQARAEVRDEESDMNKLELIRALQSQSRNQVGKSRHILSLERDIQTRVREIANLHQQLSRKEAELTRAEDTIGREQQQIHELREQVDVKQREKIQLQQQLIRQETEGDEMNQDLAQAQQQLCRKEAELTMAEETTRRKQQQIEELRERGDMTEREKNELQQKLRRQEAELVQAKTRDLPQVQQTSAKLLQENQQLRQKEQSSRRVIDDLEWRLRSSEGLVANYQKRLHRRDSELEALWAKSLSAALPSPQPRTPTSATTRDTSFPMPLVQSGLPHSRATSSLTSDSNSLPLSAQRQLTVQCHTQKKTVPCGMTRGSESAYEEIIYCTPDGSNAVYCYQFRKDQWNVLPSCPYKNSGLIVIDGVLTAVGGWNRSRPTNKLFTLRQSQWVEKYPSMNTARSSPAVVSISDGWHMNVIVIGGVGVGGWIDVVELYNTGSSTWAQVASVPQAVTLPSAAICHNHLYVIGNDGNGYSCSRQALLSSDRPISSELTIRSLTWTPLSCLPVESSTAATLCGQLVIIGGSRDWSPVNSIHQLVDGQWMKIGSISSARKWCLVASPSPDEMVVVGGYDASFTPLDSVEVCVVE